MKRSVRDLNAAICLLLACIALLVTPSSQGNPRAVKIIGGVEAEPGEFPWLVSIQALTNASGTETFENICGGTIVSRNHVVTAAHCVQYHSAKEIQIVAGAHNIREFEPSQQIVNITSIRKHAEFEGVIFRNDIALLEVFPAFEETEKVKVVQLPPSDARSSSTCAMAGWGWTSESGPGSDILLKVHLPILSKQYCASIYTEHFHPATQICTGMEEGGFDSCVGDTGGALICDDLGYKYFAGISSYGYMCARPDKPAVYTQVSRFIEWIQNNENLSLH